jgi:hypothetical protein
MIEEKCNFPVSFQFSAADLTENSQRYYEINFLLLPMHAVAKAVEVKYIL